MLNAGDYTIGWICALPTENVAAQEFLDEEHGRPEWRSHGDTNSYLLGKISRHNIVIAVLPLGEYGTASAAGVAINMLRSFPNIRIGLMVGIGGGAPRLPDRDIRLGDVVVSCPENGHGGVFQYDFGKSIQEKTFEYTRSLNQPPQALLTALAGLRTRHEREGNGLLEAVNQVLTKRPRLKRNYGRPSPDTDVLFKSKILHTGETCASCCGQDLDKVILRPEREADIDDDPAVHYGTIASGNTLMKDALLRDKLADEKDVLCFEMEAAGLMNPFPCLVIRGICDYSDSHKSKQWQAFAAMTAAAFTKNLICYLAPELVQTEQKLSSILSDIEQVATETKIIAERLESRQNTQEKDAILDWLIDTNFGTQQSDILAKRQPGTCQWFLDSVEFHNWAKNNSEILYCPGIPGSGKTVMSSVVFHDLETRFTNDTTVGLAHMYCNFRNQQNQDIRTLFASVLKQLCQQRPDIPEVIKSLHNQHLRLQTKPRFEELLKAIEAVSALYQRVYLVIDALDEWNEIEADRSFMLRELLSMQAKTGLNLFVTSRPILDIKKILCAYPSVEISASPADIALYIDGHQHMLPGFVGRTPGLLDTIKETLAKATQGMFLVTHLSFEWLKTEISVRDLQATLSQLLERSKLNNIDQLLFKTYEETMGRIFEQNRRHIDLARKVLSWVVFAMKGLKEPEIQHALALKAGDVEFDINGICDTGLIVSVCCGLVTVDEGGGTIKLVHYTTHEYLKANGALLFPDVHLYLMKQCISYLSLQAFAENPDEGWWHGFDRLETRLAQYPFYDYCANYWGLHGRRVSQSAHGEAAEIALRFLDSGPNLDAALKVMRYNNMIRGVRSMNGLHVAARFGLHFIIDALLEKHHIRARDGMGETALGYACIGGHEDVVKSLLSRLMTMDESGINWQNRVPFQDTPLHLAAYGGHSAVIEILLKQGASPHIKNASGGTPLIAGILLNYSNELMALLDAVGNTEQQIAYAEDQDLLSMAILAGNFEFVQILLGKGVDIDKRRGDGKTGLLQVITRSGTLAAVEMFVNSGANLDLQDNEGRSALMTAVWRGSVDIVCLLLKNNANLDLQDKDGETALMIGLRRISIIWPLTNASYLRDKRDFGDRASVRTCKNTQMPDESANSVIKILLDAGADVNITDNLDRTALMIAIENENSIAAGLIFERGASVDLQDNKGCTLLMKAIQADKEITSRMIIENSRNLNLQDRDSKTALDHVFEKRFNLDSDHIRRLLLEKGAKANLYEEAMDLSLECPPLIPW